MVPEGRFLYRPVHPVRLHSSFLRDLSYATDPIIHPVWDFVKRTLYKQMPSTS